MTQLTYGTAEEAGFNPERIARLRARAPEWIDPKRMRSAVLLAARHGKIVYHEAFGPLTYEPDSPELLKDSTFSIASVTKPVTATVAMILVEDGLLGLNRPVKEYLPEICGEGADAVQVQHLFTHTSGFEDDDIEKVLEEKKAQFVDLEGVPSEGLHKVNAQYFARLWDLKTNFTPGSQMSYSDHNFDLLGEIVRRVSGVPLDDFAKERLFDPLNMNDTTFDQTKVIAARSALRRPGLVYPDGVWGSATLNTTALDLARFGQMFLNQGIYRSERILSPATVHEMTRNQIPGVGVDFCGLHDEASWGLGWAVQHDERWLWVTSSLSPKGTFYHMGAGGHLIWVDPVNEIVGVYLSVCLDINQENFEHHWNNDLFQNMVTAAAV